MARNSFSKTNKLTSFFKRNWVSILITTLIFVLVIPLIVYKIQDFIRGLKENKIENEAELADTKVKTEQATNSSQNTHSSEVQLTDKFKIIQKKNHQKSQKSLILMNLSPLKASKQWEISLLKIK